MKYDGVSGRREELENVRINLHKIEKISKWPNSSTIFHLPVV